LEKKKKKTDGSKKAFGLLDDLLDYHHCNINPIRSDKKVLTTHKIVNPGTALV
jgi:hypothetical protein